MDFASLPKGLLPEGLIERLGQIHAGMDDSGPPLSALGLCWRAGRLRSRSNAARGFACHSRGRLGLLLARRAQTVGSGPGVIGGMMSDQQSLSLGERGPGIVGPLPPEVTRDCVGGGRTPQVARRCARS
jgi:hypothetical protein